MVRLPTPGSDDGIWGDVLNEYLTVSHNADGTIKTTAISTKEDVANKDIDGTLTANSDTKYASQKATKTYVDSKTYTKSDVGLGNVDNISDVNKPVSTAQQTAIDLVVSKAKLKGSVGYRPKGLDSWFTALEDAKNTPKNVVVIGDSIAVLGTAWPWRLASLMALKGRTTPDITHYRPPLSSINAPMTTCQGVLTSPVSGMGANAVTLTDGQTATNTGTMDGISIVYTNKPGNGSLEIRDGVGGTLLTTINTNTTAKSSKVWTSGALTLASHTIEVKSVGTTIFEGVYVHVGTRAKGVRVWSASVSGYTSQQFVSDPTLALNLIENLTPDLVILATGTNDGVPNYATYMGNLISAVQGVYSGSLAIWFPYSSSGGFPLSEENPARTYIDTLTLPIIDAGVSCANISTLYSDDNIHPTDQGSIVLANHAYSVIGGDPIGEIANRISAGTNNPTFTGTLTTPELSFATGNGKLANFFAAPSITLKDTANSAIQFILASAAFNNAFYGFNSVGFSMSDGTGAMDVSLYRIGSKQFSISGSTGTLAANINPSLNAQTGTSYTLVLTDAGKHITRSNASASTQTLPQNSDVAIPIGTIIPITNIGAGAVTFTAGTGATITGIVTLKQYQQINMIKMSTNGWNMWGANVSLIGTDTLTNKTINSPIIDTPTFTGTVTLPTGTTALAPLKFVAGSLLTTAVAGTMNYDGEQYYGTVDTSSGRAAIPAEQYFRLDADGSTISTIANFFGTTSNPTLVANAYYEIEIFAWFLNTTAGTVTWTFTNSAAPTNQNIHYRYSAATGVNSVGGSALYIEGDIVKDATAAKALNASASLTDAVNHYAHFKIILKNGSGTSLKIQATKSAGTITPLYGSYWKARRLPSISTGTFSA